MAILRKCKLSWAPANGDDVVGYKIYWAPGAVVGYDANAFTVGKVAETAIPDHINVLDGPVMFGITAIDREGNESDMTTLAEPFRLRVPAPPRAVALEPADAFVVVDDPGAEIVEIEMIRDLVARLEANRIPERDDSPLGDEGRMEARRAAPFDIGSLF